MCAASGYLPVAVDYATDYTSSLVLLVAGVRTTLGSCNIMLCYPVTVRACTALVTSLEHLLPGDDRCITYCTTNQLVYTR